MYDVIIIGGGVSGAASARELSRYQASVCVLEKEEDVCCGTSKANSAIVHAGYDAVPGSLMAKLNVKGNEMMEQLAKDLDFPFRRIGSLVICLSEEDMPSLEELYERGVKNGVRGLQILSGEEVRAMEPNITDQVYAALYAPTAGIVCPFNLNIALAENACENGVEFKFNTEVEHIVKIEGAMNLRPVRENFRQDMWSMRRESTRTNSTIWCVKRRSISLPGAEITAFSIKPRETMSAGQSSRFPTDTAKAFS